MSAGIPFKIISPAEDPAVSGINDPAEFWSIVFASNGTPFFVNERTNRCSFDPPPSLMDTSKHQATTIRAITPNNKPGKVKPSHKRTISQTSQRSRSGLLPLTRGLISKSQSLSTRNLLMDLSDSSDEVTTVSPKGLKTPSRKQQLQRASSNNRLLTEQKEKPRKKKPPPPPPPLPPVKSRRSESMTLPGAATENKIASLKAQMDDIMAQLNELETSPHLSSHTSSPNTLPSVEEEDLVQPVGLPPTGLKKKRGESLRSLLFESEQAEERKTHIRQISPQMPDIVDKRLRWKFQKGILLGRGGAAKVYDAIRLPDAFHFALKQIELLNDSDKITQQKEQLHREVEIMSKLEHLNILRYYGSHEQTNYVWIYLELAQKSLAVLVKEFGYLNEVVIRHYTRQILEGLTYLHSKNIIHRDIKGANILIGVDGFLKLADFGASKIVEDLLNADGQQHSSVGSPYWMAPEVARGDVYDSTADIWSVGCVVIEVVTGNHPYDGLGPVNALYRISQGIAPELAEGFLSPAGVAFINRCFKPAGLRPTALDLLSDRWLNKLDDLDPTITSDVFPRASPISPVVSMWNSSRSVLSVSDDDSAGKLSRSSRNLMAPSPRSPRKFVFKGRDNPGPSARTRTVSERQLTEEEEEEQLKQWQQEYQDKLDDDDDDE